MIASPGFVGVILNSLKYPYEIINTILSFRFIENCATPDYKND